MHSMAVDYPFILLCPLVQHVHVTQDNIEFAAFRALRSKQSRCWKILPGLVYMLQITCYLSHLHAGPVCFLEEKEEMMKRKWREEEGEEISFKLNSLFAPVLQEE